MMDLREAADLAVEVVQAEGDGWHNRRSIVGKMIYRLGNEGGSRLAEEGINEAIENGRLEELGHCLAFVH